jgi:hypothetical protein
MKTYRVSATIPADETSKGFKTASAITAANEESAIKEMLNIWPEATDVTVIGLINVFPTERGTWG